MKQRALLLHPAAQHDLLDVWSLIYRNDGPDRADGVVARLEAFIRSLEEFSEVGSRQDNKRLGIRVCGVPGLPSAAIVFQNTDQHVVVLRIAYLGRNVLSDIPSTAEAL